MPPRADNIRPYGVMKFVGDGCGRSRGAGALYHGIPFPRINVATNH